MRNFSSIEGTCSVRALNGDINSTRRRPPEVIQTQPIEKFSPICPPTHGQGIVTVITILVLRKLRLLEN